MASTRAVIYLEKDNFYYYDGNFSSVLSYHFAADLVHDLEVVNPAALNLAIKSFIDNSKIIPSQIMIVLSGDVYFEKEFPETSEFHTDSELQKFADTVPFENTSTKVYKLANSAKLVATNADLYNAIKNAFDKAGFIIEAIIPLFLLGKDIAPSGSLDVNTAKKMLEKYDLAKQNSLLLHQNGYFKSPAQKTGEKGKNDNKTLIFLLPILFTLIAVLIILYLKTSSQSAPTKPLPAPSPIHSQSAQNGTPNNFPSITLPQE